MFIENNGILYYSGRIFPTEKIQAANETTEIIKDLCPSRGLVEKIKVQCERWRHLRKNFIDVQMGTISKYNLMISTGFITQVDICGTFKAYSVHHKRRRTIKFWLIVYCCMPTSTTSLKVMDDYST